MENLNEKKQIEEMAKIVAVERGYGCTEQDHCDMSCQVCKVGCIPHEDAQILYDAGYRKQEWISVEDRLPDANTQVLAINSDGEFYVATYIEHKISPSARGYMTWASGMYNGKPTHWMPLPQAPKMKGGAE